MNKTKLLLTYHLTALALVLAPQVVTADAPELPEPAAANEAAPGADLPVPDLELPAPALEELENARAAARQAGTRQPSNAVTSERTSAQTK